MFDNRVRRVGHRDCRSGRLYAMAGCLVVDDKFAFSFDAAVDKVQTLADGGIKVSLLLAESAIPQAALFMECKRTGKTLKVDCRTVDSNAIQKRTVRKSQRRSAKEQGMDEDTGSGGQQDGDTEGWPEGSEEADYS